MQNKQQRHFYSLENSRLLIRRLFSGSVLMSCLTLVIMTGITPSIAMADTPTRLGRDVKVRFIEQLTGIAAKEIVINIPSRTLTLYEWGMPVKNWPVGLGRSTFRTPTGKFSILFKIKKPTWISPYDESIKIGPGPDNPLGTRWMEFKEDPTGDYGIHGTNSPNSVGQFSSHGCVRMRISDAETLFEKVDVKTPVRIIYNQVVSWEKNETVYIRVYADYYKKGKPTVTQVSQQLQAKFPGIQIDSTTLAKALKQANESIVQVGIISHK